MHSTGGITEFFRRLGAPLRNPLWSWGPVGNNGQVFLRQRETDVRTDEDGREYVIVAGNDRPAGGRGQNGWTERKRHIEMIRAGAKCFVILVVSDTPDLPGRRISKFNVSEIVEGGEVVRKGEATCVMVANRLPVSAFIPSM